MAIQHITYHEHELYIYSVAIETQAQYTDHPAICFESLVVSTISHGYSYLSWTNGLLSGDINYFRYDVNTVWNEQLP